MTALLRFPNVPAVYFCHDWYSAIDRPPHFPRILRYVAIDDTCYDKLIYEHSVPEDRVRLICSFVDLERFKARASLPKQPRRALIFSNYAREDAYLEALCVACKRTNLTLDVVGIGSNNVTQRPEEILSRYDIVFAKGRAALEALAVGAAVVIYFQPHVGPMVTSNELDRLRPLNFGIRAMRMNLSPDALSQEMEREIARYDAQDAAEVSRRIRAAAEINNAVDEMVSIYEEVILEQRSLGAGDIYAEGRAAAAYLRHRTMISDVSGNGEVTWSAEESLTWRMRNRVIEMPVVGTVARSFTRLLKR
jgi:hypothetical protein